jgi:hypothetical protein
MLGLCVFCKHGIFCQNYDFKLRSVVRRGPKETVEHRIFFKDGHGTQISPWHDVPLFPAG